jgi:hypothetical protein
VSGCCCPVTVLVPSSVPESSNAYNHGSSARMKQPTQCQLGPQAVPAMTMYMYTYNTENIMVQCSACDSVTV